MQEKTEPQGLSAEQYITQYVEAQKVVFDYLKHITTLDTGSIVLLTVLLEKFFKAPKWEVLVIPTFTGFMVSITALTFAAFGVIRSIRTPHSVGPALVKFTSWSFILGVGGFIVGIGSLSVLAAKNFL
jgi:hypothetical protein